MEARRRQILEAARGLIETRGYDALTMRNLANESRVTVPTIYNLIGNKEQVLFEAVEGQTIAFASKFEVGSSDLISVVETEGKLEERPGMLGYRASRYARPTRGEHK